jgi:hypothetical protein
MYAYKLIIIAKETLRLYDPSRLLDTQALRTREIGDHDKERNIQLTLNWLYTCACK